MRATPPDEWPYSPRQAASKGSSRPLSSPAWVPDSTKPTPVWSRPALSSSSWQVWTPRYEAAVVPLTDRTYTALSCRTIHTMRAARSVPSLRRVAISTSPKPSIVDSSSARHPFEAVTDGTTGFSDSRSMCGLSAVSAAVLTGTSQRACAHPWECLLLQVTAVPPRLQRGHLPWSHGQPSTGPRVPRLPAGTDHPRAGRPARLRRQPPGQGPAPRRGRATRRGQHRLLHPDGTRRPRGRLRGGPRRSCERTATR